MGVGVGPHEFTVQVDRGGQVQLVEDQPGLTGERFRGWRESGTILPILLLDPTGLERIRADIRVLQQPLLGQGQMQFHRDRHGEVTPRVARRGFGHLRLTVLPIRPSDLPIAAEIEESLFWHDKSSFRKVHEYLP